MSARRAAQTREGRPRAIKRGRPATPHPAQQLDEAEAVSARRAAPTRRAARAHGFTLIEALLALAIFGLLAVLAYRATASLMDGEARLSSEAQRWRTLETMFTRFEADIRQAIPRAVRVGAQWEPAWLGTADAANASALVFTRAGSEFHTDPGAVGQRLSYRLRDGTLELAYWPQLDHTQNATPTVYPLIGEVTSFRLQYLTGQGAWRTRWPLLGETDVPRAVRLSLTFADGAELERWFALR